MKKIGLISLLFIASLVSCGTTSTSNTNVERTISSIEIVERPTQTIFAVGETLDLSGLKVKINYSDSTYNYVGSASLTYPEMVNSTSQNAITLKYEGYETSLDGLEFRESKKTYFEAESNHAYWSKPNNHNRDTFFIKKENSNAHGGAYIDGLTKECFSLSYMFYADELVNATFKLGTDARTTTYSQNLTPTTPDTRPLAEIYEFHVNGLKVDLNGDLANGEWGNFKEIMLGRAKLRKGLNTISLTHILRNGENGNIDFISVDTITKVETTNYNRQLIEAEDMQVSGGDHKNEGNNASKTGKNQNFDNVGNRANGQTGWLMTTVNSEKTQKAALYINFGLCAKFNLSDWEISVNNEVIKYVDVLIPYHFWEGIAWKDWNEFYVCELPLQKGENLIKIEKVDASTDGTNIDYIVLLTAN